MADTLSKNNLFSPCQNRSLLLKSRQKNISIVRFSRNNGFLGKRLDLANCTGNPIKRNSCAVSIQMNLSFPKAFKWWKKGLQPNMREIESAQDLVDSLLKAGDQLVIVDFFSPGCGGCKAFHPKICQFAEMNPDVLFLQVNHEEHKSMCYSLTVHVLPFFRFYRGAEGRLCSFSCTNATIKKFRDALAKHTTDRCSIGPTKGLEESELLALAANKDLSFTYARISDQGDRDEPIPSGPKLPVVQLSTLNEDKSNKTLVHSG